MQNRDHFLKLEQLYYYIHCLHNSTLTPIPPQRLPLILRVQLKSKFSDAKPLKSEVLLMINCFIFQVSHKNLSWSKEGILSSHSLTIDPQNWPMTSSEKSWPTASFICELLVSIYVDRRHYFYLEWSQNELFATCHIQLVWGPLIFQGQQSRCSSSPSVLLKMWQSRSSSP